MRTSESTRLFFVGSTARTKAEVYTEGQLGAHLDLYFAPIYSKRARDVPDAARNRLVMVRAGYRFGRTPPTSTDPFIEHTGLIEFTPRFPLPVKLLLLDRNRFDLRFVNRDFLPRYRNRLRMERTFPLALKSVTPYVDAEAFYDWRYRAFHRMRYSAGAEFAMSRHVVLEGYYLRQEDSRATVRTTNVAGIVLQIYVP